MKLYGYADNFRLERFLSAEKELIKRPRSHRAARPRLGIVRAKGRDGFASSRGRLPSGIRFIVLVRLLPYFASRGRTRADLSPEWVRV